MSLRSKLPGVGLTIFDLVSQRARKLHALDLGQGSPNYDIDQHLSELVMAAMRAGHNQYAPLEGVLELREQIANKCAQSHRISVDPQTEITVTVGATEALYSVIQAVVHPGEEVIIFDPSYDSYEPTVRLAGARCIRVPLSPPSFSYDWDRVSVNVTPRTRLIIFNTPHNPSCKVARQADLDALAEITRKGNILVLSDEVYEHAIFDGHTHHSVLAHPELRTRSFAVASFGKTLHATGIRVGYCIAPPELTLEVQKIHQFATFCIATPLQIAIANYMRERAEYWSGLPAFFQAKRDRLRSALAGTPFSLPPSEGTYFQLLDFSAVAPPGDVEFAERLITEVGLATIPISPFYEAPPKLSVVRLCLAKRDDCLDEAAARLRSLEPQGAGTT